MIRKLFMLCFVLTIGTLLFACGADNLTEDQTTTTPGDQTPEQVNGPTGQLDINDNDVVAMVNGEEIRGSSYNIVLERILMNMQAQGQDPRNELIFMQAHMQAIDSVIGNKLLYQEAIRTGHQPDDQRLATELEMIKTNFETSEDFEAALAQANLTEEELLVQLREDLAINMYIEHEVQIPLVSDEELQTFYNDFIAPQENAPQLADIESQLRQMIQDEETQLKLSSLVEELKEDSVIEILV